MKNHVTRTRLTALAAVAATVATGLAIRALSDGSFAKYAGDALYTVLLYALLVLAIPGIRPLTAALAALGLSWAIEFLQLTPIPAELSRQSTLARLILGSTFNPPDLLWYTVGAISAFLLHTAVRRATRRTSRPYP